MRWSSPPRCATRDNSRSCMPRILPSRLGCRGIRTDAARTKHPRASAETARPPHRLRRLTRSPPMKPRFSPLRCRPVIAAAACRATCSSPISVIWPVAACVPCSSKLRKTIYGAAALRQNRLRSRGTPGTLLQGSGWSGIECAGDAARLVLTPAEWQKKPRWDPDHDCTEIICDEVCWYRGALRRDRHAHDGTAPRDCARSGGSRRSSRCRGTVSPLRCGG